MSIVLTISVTWYLLVLPISWPISIPFFGISRLSNIFSFFKSLRFMYTTFLPLSIVLTISVTRYLLVVADFMTDLYSPFWNFSFLKISISRCRSFLSVTRYLLVLPISWPISIPFFGISRSNIFPFFKNLLFTYWDIDRRKLFLGNLDHFILWNFFFLLSNESKIQIPER